VTRDFSQTYKNAINEALPKAKQIVDRFHILKNLTDDLNEYIKRNIKETIKMINTKGKELIEEEQILNKRQRNKKESAETKWEVIQEVQKLYKDGFNKSEIARKMNISRQTIYVYLEQKQPLERSTHSILDTYVPMIKKLILEGKKIDEIYNEIKANGYKGKTSLFNSRLRGIRQEVRTNTKYLKRSKIKKLLFYDIEEIKDENLRNDLKEYLETNKELNTLLSMIKKFKEILFSKRPRKLVKWIREAKKINVKELNSFVTLIESDIDAVKNAIKYDYSNGLTEGFNNKTKVIKRIMYGRCSFDLLRLKILT
jgi:transposase